MTASNKEIGVDKNLQDKILEVDYIEHSYQIHFRLVVVVISYHLSFERFFFVNVFTMVKDIIQYICNNKMKYRT